jgi:hypothetical protein
MSRVTGKTLKGVFLRAWGGGKATLLTVMVALTLATVTPAFGANGSTFILGSLNNTATAITRLVGNVNGPALWVINPNTGASATGATFQVASGHPPFKVNSSIKVPNLNSDKVDGQSFACPTGTRLHEGVCVETALRSASASFSAAQTDCLNEPGTRLPTPAELQTLAGRTNNEWSNHTYLDHDGTNTGAVVLQVLTDKTIGTFSQTGELGAYRCVKQPS